MAVDGVNNAQATTAVGTGSVTSAQYLTADRDPAGELETLLRGTFDFCDSPEAVNRLVGQIASALTSAGLDATGPLMSFVLQLASGAKARLGGAPAAPAAAAADGAPAADGAATTATQAAAPTGALAADGAAARELEVLLYGAYSQCSTPQQALNLTTQIRGALEHAGLPTTGALPDFVDQLGTYAAQLLFIKAVENQRLQAEIDKGGGGNWG